VLPFDNTLAGIELTGAQLLAALEHGVSNWPADGRLPQVSGLTFTFNPNKPVGQRIVSVTVNGEPLDPNKVYRVATNDFMAAGGDSYTMMVGAPFFHGSERGDGYFLRDVVAAYLEENPVVAPRWRAALSSWRSNPPRTRRAGAGGVGHQVRSPLCLVTLSRSADGPDGFCRNVRTSKIRDQDVDTVRGPWHNTN
jgi:5''-nucleotidase/2'',3''-cyclic phosphodiesterase and related esterases